MSEQEHYGEYLFNDPWITGLVKRICEERDAATKRAEKANQYALGMEAAANIERTQNAALLREVAGLRYYIAQLERNVSQEERAYAAGVASLMLSQYDIDKAQSRK